MAITIEEAMNMRGFEFIYVYEDGDTIPAFIKEFDPEIGLTCGTLDIKTRDGWNPAIPQKEDDGTWCVIGNHIGDNSDLEECLRDLEIIRDTKRFAGRNTGGFGFVSCAFS